MAIVTPHLATDGIIEVFDENGSFRGIVVIRRKNPPTGLALPGGFVDVGERVEAALVREMKEETHLDVSDLELLGVYSDPARDNRFHTVSVVYVCKATGEPRGGDDAKTAEVFPLDRLPMDDLVFDHKEIIRDYLARRNDAL